MERLIKGWFLQIKRGFMLFVVCVVSLLLTLSPLLLSFGRNLFRSFTLSQRSQPALALQVGITFCYSGILFEL